MWERFIIGALLSILKAVIKNPGKAETLKKDLVIVRDIIGQIYPD